MIRRWLLIACATSYFLERVSALVSLECCVVHTISLLLDLRLGVVTCTKAFVHSQILKYRRKTTIICKSRNCIVVARLYTVLYRCYRTSLSYAIHTRYTKFIASIVFPSAEEDLLPARLLFQRLLPVLDVISNDLSSLVGGEVAADGLDEVALRVYTWMLA
jgi:hypothetical protein